MMPPPYLLAELPLTVQPARVRLPQLKMPPPYVDTLPPEMVRPEIEAVARPTSKTRLLPPPLMVTPAAGPVIVWGVRNTVGSKTIVFAWLLALAWSMQ